MPLIFLLGRARELPNRATGCVPHKHISLCTYPFPAVLGGCLLHLQVHSPALGFPLALFARGTSGQSCLLWTFCDALGSLWAQVSTVEPFSLRSSPSYSAICALLSAAGRLILCFRAPSGLSVGRLSQGLHRAALSKVGTILLPAAPHLPAAELLPLHFSFSLYISRPLVFGGFPAGPQLSQSEILQPCVIGRVGNAVEHNVKELRNIVLWSPL